MIVNLIVARSRNNVIGKNGTIPWKIKGEQIQFKELTTGNAVVMGRKTYEDIGRPLPNRLNIVISNTKDFGSRVDMKELTTLITVKSLQEAIDLVGGMSDIDLYISGGRGLYEEAIPLVDRMYITEVDKEIEDDGTCVFFPEFNEDEFDKLTGESVEESIFYTRTVYVRKTSKNKFLMTGVKDLSWEESQLARDDAAKFHAALPGDIGTVTVSEKIGTGSKKPYFTVHFQVKQCERYRGFSGMRAFQDQYTSIDDVKSDIGSILRRMFRDKLEEAQARVRAAQRAIYMTQTIGRDI